MDLSNGPSTFKRILVVGGSQSGQLNRILDRIIEPLKNRDSIVIDRWNLDGFNQYPFPWPFWDFFDAFPESVLQIAPPIRDTPGLHERYDLVVIGYQSWFLSLALPVTAFLDHPLAARLLEGTPIVAVMACRNMWMETWKKFKARLESMGGRVLDHIVFIDEGPTLSTLVMEPRWLLTGRKDTFLGLPEPGVAEAQIEASPRFGHALAEALRSDLEKGTEPLLKGLQAVTVDPKLALSERAGVRMFGIWSRLVRRFGGPGQKRRRPLLLCFVAYLVLAIILIVPASLLIQTLLSPILRRRFNRLRSQMEAPSGSGSERMDQIAEWGWTPAGGSHD